MSAEPDLESRTTVDALLDGRVRLTQAAAGYRVAIDPVVLAAAVPAGRGDHVVDLGAGAGAASLCLTARVPDCRVTAIEIDPAAAGLARHNAGLNNAADRMTVVEDSVMAVRSNDIGVVDHVMANPPYLPPGRAATSHRHERAMVEQDGLGLGDWIAAALSLVRTKGTVTFVQRADRLDDLLKGLGLAAGGIIVYPLWPKAGRPAKRILVRARKGVASPLSLKSGMVLHGDDGAYTDAAESVLRHATTIAME